MTGLIWLISSGNWRIFWRGGMNWIVILVDYIFLLIGSAGFYGAGYGGSNYVVDNNILHYVGVVGM